MLLSCIGKCLLEHCDTVIGVSQVPEETNLIDTWLIKNRKNRKQKLMKERARNTSGFFVTVVCLIVKLQQLKGRSRKEFSEDHFLEVK